MMIHTYIYIYIYILIFILKKSIHYNIFFSICPSNNHIHIFMDLYEYIRP